jgi:uncharacterized membrane protein
LLVVVAALAAAIVWFVGHRLHYLTDYSLASYSDYFWPRRLGLYAHVSAGIVAISAGLVQIWLGLANHVGTLHRTLGKLYAVAVFTGVASGFYLALTIPGHLSYATGLFMLSTAWLVTTCMALYAIHRRQYEQHRQWMLRSFTVTFAFVTFRLIGGWLKAHTHVPEDMVADDIDTLMSWACWAVPLLLLEMLIQLRAIRSTVP